MDRLWRVSADALEAGSLWRSIDALRRILEIVPRFEPALVRLVELEGAIKNFEGASTAARRLVDAFPERPEHHELLSRALLEQAEATTNAWVQKNRLEEALAAVRRSRALGLASASGAGLESEVLWKLGRCRESQAVLLGFLDAATQLGSSELRLVMSLLRTDAWDVGTTHLRRIMDRLEQLLPGDPEGRRSVGHALCDLASSLLGDDCPDLAFRSAEVGARCLPGDAGATELLERCRAEVRWLEASRSARRPGTLNGRTGCRYRLEISTPGLLLATMIVVGFVVPIVAGFRTDGPPRHRTRLPVYDIEGPLVLTGRRSTETLPLSLPRASPEGSKDPAEVERKVTVPGMMPLKAPIVISDRELEAHVQRVASLTPFLSPGQGRICGLLDAYLWYRRTEGAESPRAREALEILLSGAMRSALRAWYLECGDDLNPEALEMRRRLSALAGEDFGPP